LLPTTAARTAKNVGVPFDARRLTTDAAFNAQLGAAHLGELAQSFDGSYVMVFAAYNAGPSRVVQWLQRYGDPRKPDTDPVDWVERIPFTETRNYVQRVMENTQIYRTRLAGRTALLIERDMVRGGSAN
jgi:soluble lytic murein transglycosylase